MKPSVDNGTLPVWIDTYLLDPKLLDPALSSECLRVCGHLARLGDETGVVRRRTVAIAKACRMDQRQVQEALNLAEGHDLIERDRAAEDDGERVYHLTRLYGRLRVDPEVDDLRLNPLEFHLYLKLVHKSQEGDATRSTAA